MNDVKALSDRNYTFFEVTDLLKIPSLLKYIFLIRAPRLLRAYHLWELEGVLPTRELFTVVVLHRYIFNDLQ